MKIRLSAGAALIALGLAEIAGAQVVGMQTGASRITLAQAVESALGKNPLRKAAVADTKVASADVRGSHAAFLPRIMFSETATRGNDPVYVFGSKLRQERFTANDFALNKLNTPTPFGNFSTRLGGTWNLFDSFASWHGMNRARRMDEAAGEQLARTDQEVVYRVVESYYGVLLAAKEMEVTEHSLKTAEAILDTSQARFDSGLAVESDLLLAKVRMASRRQESIRARNNAELSRAQLATAMGVPDDSMEPAEALVERTLPVTALAELEQQARKNRPDLRRAQAEESAQRESVAMVRAAYGPRVNAFGSWEMDNPTFAAGGGGNNWLAGVELQFDIFQGGAKRAQLARERALEEKAGAMKQAASDAVRLEVRRSYYSVESARQEVEVARAAIAQAQESLRISQDRYEAGLTTMTDLLGAEEATRRSQADYWEAVYRFHTSYAGLELASGTLGPQSPVVTP